MWLRNRVSEAFVSITQLEGFLSALFILVIFNNPSSLHPIYTKRLKGCTLYKKNQIQFTVYPVFDLPVSITFTMVGRIQVSIIIKATLDRVTHSR